MKSAQVLSPLARDQRGIVLPLALMALIVLGTLSVALLTIGTSEIRISYNYLWGTQAQFVSEAGLEVSFAAFVAQPALLGTAANQPTPAGVPINGTLASFGNYALQYQNAGDSTVLAISTGTNLPGTAQKVLRAIVTNGFVSNDAIRTNGDLGIPGNPTVRGSCGSVHTNRNADIRGTTATVSQALTATGTYGGPTTLSNGSGGTITPAAQQPRKIVPAIRASDFWDVAAARTPTQAFRMENNGTVTDGSGAIVFTYAPGRGKQAAQATYQGWQWNPPQGANPGQWTLSNAAQANDATYFFQTSVSFTGGNFKATILSTGNIELGGNVSLTSHLTDTLLVADMDIKFTGTSGSTRGLIAAHEQIELAGTVTINGSVLAEDATNTPGSPVASNSVAGTVTVTYSCDQGPPVRGPVRFIAWGI